MRKLEFDSICLNARGELAALIIDRTKSNPVAKTYGFDDILKFIDREPLSQPNYRLILYTAHDAFLKALIDIQTKKLTTANFPSLGARLIETDDQLHSCVDEWNGTSTNYRLPVSPDDPNCYAELCYEDVRASMQAWAQPEPGLEPLA